MKTLYLLRHAHTLPQAPSGTDFDRALSPLGEKQAESIGKFMQANDMKPDFILCSSARRTSQTAELALAALFGGTKTPVTFDRDLYHAPADRLLEFIHNINQTKSHLLLVCHNPGAAELAYQLGGLESYAPGTLSAYTATSWQNMAPEIARLTETFVPD